MIDPLVVERVKRIDIVRLIGRELRLTRRGSEYVALCPFHDEDTPSFAVIPKKGAFYCFGCKAGGGPIDWIMQREQIGFREAVERLAAENGVEVTEATDASPAPARHEPAVSVLRGRPPKGPVLTLDRARWDHWAEQRTGAVERFCAKRGLDEGIARHLGLVDLDASYLGFTYMDPDTREPCTVKVRSVEGKRFWVEPRPPKDDTTNARAALPLYLAHDLAPIDGDTLQVVTITEGETDALTLRCIGIRNVVSLPQGVGSASYTDLLPLLAYHGWVVATDDDEEGDGAARVLVDRARRIGVSAVRCRWGRVVGDDVLRAKDANQFLLDGATREDFEACIARVLEASLGFVPRLAP